jgi:hypothetical protein
LKNTGLLLQWIMPHLFRTTVGRLWKPSERVALALADGTIVQGTWAGSAKEEMLKWWLSQNGNRLAQTEQVSEVAIKADDDKEIIWGPAPVGARLIFVLESQPGKNYHLAKMVTTASTPAQVLYFRHERFSLFGSLKPDETIEKIPPLMPPPLPPPKQGRLL